MYKIFIGIPSIRRYEPFWESLDDFVQALKEEYEVHIFKVSDKTVAEARNTIADTFLKSDSDYLLFLDDDHTGHSMEMFKAILDPILNNDSVMCGIKCHTKYFPYASCILIYSGIDEKALGLQEGAGKYVPLDIDKGYIYADLVGFGMTLITRKAFGSVEAPYFISKDNGKEDNYFCDKLVNKGLHPVGCFEYTLDHQGIGKHNALKLREEQMAALKQKHPNLKVLVS